MPRDEAATPADTDWSQIVSLCVALQQMAPSPVVELNLAAAVAMATGPAVGWSAEPGSRRLNPEADARRAAP